MMFLFIVSIPSGENAHSGLFSFASKWRSKIFCMPVSVTFPIIFFLSKLESIGLRTAKKRSFVSLEKQYILIFFKSTSCQVSLLSSKYFFICFSFRCCINSSFSFFFKSFSTTAFGFINASFSGTVFILRRFTSPYTVSLCIGLRIAQLSPFFWEIIVFLPAS